MSGVLLSACGSVLSGVTLAAIGFFWRSISKDFATIKQEHAALVASQRNQLKASIVRSYEEAQARGCVTALELETMNRRADSYFELGGNNYIHALMEQANAMPVKGDIPR